MFESRQAHQENQKKGLGILPRLFLRQGGALENKIMEGMGFHRFLLIVRPAAHVSNR